MSVLLVDMREAQGKGLTIRPVRTMLNHATTELFFDDLEVPAANLIGDEGKGFRYILSGMNAERILIASECIGDGRFFIDRAAAYAKDRSVFGRAIRSEEHTSELQSLMRISYAVFCLQKKKYQK